MRIVVLVVIMIHPGVRSRIFRCSHLHLHVYGTVLLPESGGLQVRTDIRYFPCLLSRPTNPSLIARQCHSLPLLALCTLAD